jgi:hypothetical protein
MPEIEPEPVPDIGLLSSIEAVDMALFLETIYTTIHGKYVQICQFIQFRRVVLDRHEGNKCRKLSRSLCRILDYSPASRNYHGIVPATIHIKICHFGEANWTGMKEINAGNCAGACAGY